MSKHYRPYRYRPAERPSGDELDKMKEEMRVIGGSINKAKKEAYEEIERKKREEWKRKNKP